VQYAGGTPAATAFRSASTARAPTSTACGTRASWRYGCSRRPRDACTRRADHERQRDWPTGAAETAQHTIEELGSASAYLEEIERRLAEDWSEEVPNWTKCQAQNTTICPDEWAAEIEPINCSNVWDGIEEGDDLGDEYYYANYILTEKLLAQGGLRLAAVLNEIFSE